MSPTITSPRKIMKPVKRWNSFLSIDHRRSQSLNAVQKSPSIDFMQSTTSLDTFRSRDDDKSSISSIHEPIVEEDQIFDISPTRSTHSRQSYGGSPPPRPAPAPRLWDDQQGPQTSLAGLETVIAPYSNTPSSVYDSPTLGPSRMTQSPVPESPNSMISKFSTAGGKSFAGRRKASLPDLDLVGRQRPFSPASPTLPPILSARTPNTVITHGSITPRPFSGDMTTEKTDFAALRTPEWQERDQKRASSILLPLEIAPIVVPSVPARIPPVPPIDTSVMNRREEDMPPRPPPKSPRTLLRAFPIPKSSTMPGGHTANSSVASISPIDTPSTAATTWSPVSVQSAKPTSETFSKSLPKETLSRSPPKINTVTFEEPARFMTASSRTTTNKAAPPILKHGRSVSTEPRMDRKPSPALASHHTRMASDTSVINRGRPMKRGEAVQVRGPARASKMGLINDQFHELPQGFRRSQTGGIPVNELHGLRRDAEELASTYKILTQKQIAGLDQEQRLLDENCDQIYHTISELKSKRKSIYNSLKTYLDAPNATFSLREHAMKHTIILNDLDSQIDALQTKLDLATDRKLAIQSRVWEHLAAILTAVSLAAEVRTEEQTPPISPERQIRRNSTEDSIQEDGVVVQELAAPVSSHVESITVYADSGVASLLRSIEEELDVIDQSRYYDTEIMV